MADTTKLASTFKAYRLLFRVGSDAGDVIRRCKLLGLQPKVTGYYEQSSVLVFSVVIPEKALSVDPVFKTFSAAMAPYSIGLEGLPVKVELICPPLEEKPCEIGAKRGRCPSCSRMVPLIGPITLGKPGNMTYLTCPHDSCCSNNEPENGSVCDPADVKP